MEQNLEDDIERVSSILSEEEMITVMVSSELETQQMQVKRGDDVHKSILMAFGLRPTTCVSECQFGGDSVLPGDTFASHGIEVTAPPNPIIRSKDTPSPP